MHRTSVGAPVANQHASECESTFVAAGVMANRNEQQKTRTEEIIAAFDRERAEARELSRRLIERLQASREYDRQFTFNPRRRQQ